MRPRHNRAITLIELLIALVLFTIIVLGLSSIDLFTNNQVLTASRRAKIQNEVTIALEHMTKKIAQACGNEISSGADSVISIVSVVPPGDDGNTIRFYVDSNGDYTPDLWRAYIYYNYGHATNKNQILFCNQCADSSCSSCTSGWETVAYNIATFDSAAGLATWKPVSGNDYATTGSLTQNFVTIRIQSCWDPSRSDCGTTPNNPSVVMKAKIKLPSVSVN